MALLAAIVLALGVWLWIVFNALRATGGHYDFAEYYAAARALAHDPHANIYDPDVLVRAVAGLGLPNQPPPYLYPPLAAILMLPLGLLPFVVAENVWLSVNAVIWLGATLLLANEARHILTAQPALKERLRAPMLIAVALACLLCLPSRPPSQTLGLGQINFLVMLPLALVPWLTRTHRERWVGVAIGLAALLKLTPLILLAYLLLRRRWHALAAACLTLAGLAALSLAVVGPRVWADMVSALLEASAYTASFANNESLVGPVFGAGAAALPAAAGALRLVQYALLGALALGVGLLLVRRRGEIAGPTDAGWLEEDAAYAAALCLVVLLSPSAWAHHYTWLLPSAVLVVALALRRYLLPQPGDAPPGRGKLALGAAALGAILLALPLPFGWDTDPAARTTAISGLPLRPLVQELRPLGALALVAVALALLHESTRQSRGPTSAASSPDAMASPNAG